MKWWTGLVPPLASLWWTVPVVVVEVGAVFMGFGAVVPRMSNIATDFMGFNKCIKSGKISVLSICFEVAPIKFVAPEAMSYIMCKKVKQLE